MTDIENAFRPEFVYATYIATTPEKLWQALTSAEFTQQYWFGNRLESDWQPGSEVVLWTPSGERSVKGVVVECDPPRRLSYSFISSTDREPRETPSQVTFALEPFGPTVKLTLTHVNLLPRDFGSAANHFRGVNNGWAAIMSGLKTLLETGHGLMMGA